MVKFWPKKKISDVLKFFPNSDFSKFYDIWVVKKDKIFTFNIIISHIYIYVYQKNWKKLNNLCDLHAISYVIFALIKKNQTISNVYAVFLYNF